MNYTPLWDLLVTGSEIVVIAAVALNYIADAIFWRRCARMLRNGAHFGGELR